MVFGAAEIGIAGCLFLGLFQTATYGAALALHVVTVLESWRQLLDPCGDPANHLFIASVPVLAALMLRRITPRSPTPLRVFQDVLIGDRASPMPRLYRKFRGPMNLPAELSLQKVRTLFQDDALTAGRMRWGACRARSTILA
jgi:hypothetical protein